MLNGAAYSRTRIHFFSLDILRPLDQHERILPVIRLRHGRGQSIDDLESGQDTAVDR